MNIYRKLTHDKFHEWFFNFVSVVFFSSLFCWTKQFLLFNMGVENIKYTVCKKTNGKYNHCHFLIANQRFNCCCMHFYFVPCSILSRIYVANEKLRRNTHTTQKLNRRETISLNLISFPLFTFFAFYHLIPRDGIEII